ncbi:type III secretion system TyeA family effector delivery regulator [Cupriavidus gilardii J11]|uniref:Type III secretion system TyeA family effector delivery regulator n=1 Tax=Cupriavidus gilardii J11 TaxID=936133 RepID=A0A562BIF2_9BURK|nr:TyeA family type III secretion system gatekeeper subunit [Cupriavidus gilardii]TWG84965.1 type III secretion system TyeA family effector delivery regulator [Cupriavidus gilardii J11]
MTNKVQSPTPVPRPAAPVTAPATVQQAGVPMPQRGPQQMMPARSAIDLAAKALNVTRRMAESGIANVHAAKLHALLRGDRRNEALVARAFVGKLAKSLLSAKDPRIEHLLQQFIGLDDEDELFSVLDKAELHPAAMALVLAAMAEQHRPGRRRTRLEDRLAKQLGSGRDWELAMLGWLEFGAMQPELMTQLKNLYQRAGVVQQGLAAFFAELSGVGDRRRKVKVLIRALGAELAGLDDDPPEGVRLAAVVRDLKRLLIFLGCEEQCARIAIGLGQPTVETDAVLGLLIRMIDQGWLYADWLQAACEAIPLEPRRGFKLARDINRMVKLLPDPCFRDDDHRDQVLSALAEFIERGEDLDQAEPEAPPSNAQDVAEASPDPQQDGESC